MKLTLRDLFWMITLGAILTAWWLDRREQSRLANAVEAAEQKIERLQDANNTLFDNAAALRNSSGFYHRTGGRDPIEPDELNAQ